MEATAVVRGWHVGCQYGASGEPPPTHDWVIWMPRKTRIPMALHEVIVVALKKHAAMPQFETDS